MSQSLTTTQSLEAPARNEDFDRTRMIMLGGVGMVIGLAVPALSYSLLVGSVPAIASASDRVAYALPWMCLPVLALMAGMAAIAAGRLSSEYVDGSPPPSGTRLDMHRRYMQNTVEQITIFVPTQLALATVLPDDRLALIPAWAILFLLARFTFWVGYLINSVFRSVGMMMTFPNMFALFYVLSQTMF